MANYKKLKIKAYNIIKQKILNNELQPGEYLEEKMLCEMLDVSRTPIREAISLLENENLVQIIPNKGIFVTTFTIQSVKELFQARHLMEPMALQLSFKNLNIDILVDFKKKFSDGIEKKDYPLLHELDYKFHNYLNSKCNNAYLVRYLKNISDNFQRVRTMSFYTVERTEAGAQEHIQLIELIIEEDLHGSIEFLERHISNTEKYYFKSLL